MGYWLGVDLGTTFTAAAIVREGETKIVSLGTHQAAIPSVVHIRDDGTILTGEPAQRRALTEPDRVGREFKRRLGDTTPLLLGGSAYSAESLMAKVLRSVLEHVTAAEGGPPEHIAVSHPANWGEYKLDLLRQAVQLADLPTATLLSEPESAATFYANDQRMNDGEIIAVYDLGGGTFDAAVLEKTAEGFQLLGSPMGIERLGGLDFDTAVFNHVVQSLGSLFEDLDDADPQVLAAVARVRAECTAARESLSGDTEAVIPVLLPGHSSEVHLSRSELESMIRPAVSDTVAALDRTIRSAGLTTSDISAVLLVGGASRTPLVSQMVSAHMQRPVVVDAHPKHAIAMGAAQRAAAELGQSPSQPTQTPQTVAAEPPQAAEPPTAPESAAGAEPPVAAEPTEPSVATQPPVSTQLPVSTEPPTQQIPAASPEPALGAVPPMGAPVAPAAAAPQKVSVSAEPQPAAVASPAADPLASMATSTPLVEPETEVVRRRSGPLVAMAAAGLVLFGALAYGITRFVGSDPQTETAAGGADSEPVDQQPAASEGDESDSPAADDSPAVSLVTATIDAGSMVKVDVAEGTIGTDDHLPTNNPPEFAPKRDLESPVSAFVDVENTTNLQFYDYASWTALQPGNDAEATWVSLVPESWREASPTLPESFEAIGLDPGTPVSGVGFEAATGYCSYALKRPVTETEWELAAAAGLINADLQQNWVVASETYEPVPGALPVLRGSIPGTSLPVYQRTIGDNPITRANAGIRCAADAVVERAHPSGELLYLRVFGGDDPERDWPDFIEVPAPPDSAFGYHAPDVFHIETRIPQAVAVNSGIPQGDNVTISLDTEPRKPQGPGDYAYGLVANATSNGFLSFTVKPVEIDGGLELEWCVRRQNFELWEPDTRVAVTPSLDVCEVSGQVPVSSLINNLTMRLEDGNAEFSIDGERVGEIAISLDPQGQFGLVAESFDPTIEILHMHYDNLALIAN